MSEKSLTPTQLLVEAQARIATLETQVNANAETVNQLSLVSQERDKLTADMATATARIAELEKSAIDIDAEVEKRSSLRAQEILATTGVVQPVSAVAEPVNQNDLWQRYESLNKSDPAAATRFYRTNRSRLVG